MKKARSAIPKSVKEAVLNEYNHLCAMCGEPCPHIHHIDQNPENNGPLNLIPLCPNHHLNDQHNPTTRIDIGILRLFRKYKDPAILTPQFKPLFDRMRYLYSYKTLSSGEIQTSQIELCEFIHGFNMGPYYLHKLCDVNPLHFRSNAQDMEMCERETVSALRRDMEKNWGEVERLLIEMLRYQNWLLQKEKRHKSAD